MQNRYAGDVGDFGKLGMLRCIENAGLSVGVNWYLVKDESHNSDGKHITYLQNKKFLGCDDELLVKIHNMLQQTTRSVYNLEKLNLLQTGKYYNQILHEPKQQDFIRDIWHQNALTQVKDCDIVFLDPDNGLLPKSVGRGSYKSVKFVLPEEIIDYYKAGHSVVFYNHRTRERLDVYLRRFDNLFEAEELKGSIIRGLTFKRGTLRDYFFIIHPDHLAQIDKCLEELLYSKWREHFILIEL